MTEIKTKGWKNLIKGIKKFYQKGIRRPEATGFCLWHYLLHCNPSAMSIFTDTPLPSTFAKKKR